MNREPRRLPGSRKSVRDYNLPMSLPGQSLDIRLLVDRIPAFTWSAHPDGSVEFVNQRDRKSTRLNSSHGYISYAVFCLKKKNNHTLNYSININSIHDIPISNTYITYMLTGKHDSNA